MARFVIKDGIIKEKDKSIDYDKYFSPSNIPIIKNTTDYKLAVPDKSYNYEYPVYDEDDILTNKYSKEEYTEHNEQFEKEHGVSLDKYVSDNYIKGEIEISSVNGYGNTKEFLQQMLRDTVSFTDIAERVCNTMENKFNDGNTYYLHEKMFFEFPDDIAEDLKNYEKKICRNKKTHEDTCLLNFGIIRTWNEDGHDQYINVLGNAQTPFGYGDYNLKIKFRLDRNNLEQFMNLMDSIKNKVKFTEKGKSILDSLQTDLEKLRDSRKKRVSRSTIEERLLNKIGKSHAERIMKDTMNVQENNMGTSVGKNNICKCKNSDEVFNVALYYAKKYCEKGNYNESDRYILGGDFLMLPTVLDEKVYKEALSASNEIKKLSVQELQMVSMLAKSGLSFKNNHTNENTEEKKNDFFREVNFIEGKVIRKNEIQDMVMKEINKKPCQTDELTAKYAASISGFENLSAEEKAEHIRESLDTIKTMMHNKMVRWDAAHTHIIPMVRSIDITGTGEKVRIHDKGNSMT